MNEVRLDNKTVIVTGANTGIGKETARELARRGARVILACRSESRAEEARIELISDTKNQNIVYQHLDLSSLASVKQFADNFNAVESRLDILVNNAGVLTADRLETVDGYEMHFGINHLGHFYLTYLLLEKLKNSAPSRIVVVSSVAHELNAKLDFDDLQVTRSFGTFAAYGKSKTANILFAVHLAKLLAGTGVTTYSLHPGSVDTEISRDLKGVCLFKCLGCLYHCFGCCFNTLTPVDGAATTLYCCLEPSIAQHSGRYYSDCKEKKAKSYATDPVIAEKLWNISLQLCHVTS